MHYTSNERNYFSLSVGILDSENKHESKEIYEEMYFLNLRHSSLNSNILITYVSFHISNLYNERAIHVKKITVKKIIFEYISLCFTDSIVHFYQIHVIRKVLYAVL